MRKFVLLLFLVTVACGNVTSSSGSGSGSGSGDSGSGDSGSGDRGGGDDGDTSTDFAVKGTLSSLEVSSSLGLKGTNTSGTVSQVMAVSPETGNTTCKTSSVGSNGSFKLEIAGKKPWFFYFFDRLKTGRRMFLGRLQTSKLDTLIPTTTTGTLDLGTVTIDSATGIASSSKSHGSIIGDLGLTSSDADTIGDLDDIASRYESPDIDGDGKVDCDESKKYRLDFHVRFDMKVSGQKAKVTDIIDSFLSETDTTAEYTGTGVYTAYPSSFSTLDTGSVTFVDSTVTTSEGGAIVAGTATSSVTTNNFGDFRGFGPNTTSTSELPSGEVQFAFGSKTLTFSGLKTPALSKLTAPTGRIFPFIKLNKSDSACATNCTLSGVSYQWRKKTATGWTKASLTEIDLLVASGTLSFRVDKDSDSSKTVSFSIPKTSVEGTIEWKAANATLSGVTAAEFTALVTTQICHIGLSYDDKLGMRYFEGIDNATGTCS